jgi:hypothetical protein
MIHAGYARAGFLPAQRLIIIEDDPPAQPAAGTLLRVYNLAYNLAWDMHLGGTAAVTADASVPAPRTRRPSSGRWSRAVPPATSRPWCSRTRDARPATTRPA